MPPEPAPDHYNNVSTLPMTQPHDLDAEQAVLGGLLLPTPADAAARAHEDVTASMTPEDHYRPAHETIHRAILDMHAADEPVDPITVAAFLRLRGDLERVGGSGYLHNLVQHTPTASHAGSYAEIVHEMAERRRLDAAGIRLSLNSRGASPEDARAEALSCLSGEDSTSWSEPVPLGEHGALPTFPVDALPAWLSEYVAAVAEFTQTPPDMAATMGLAALSTAAGGRVHFQVRPGWVEQSNLYLVCAMPPASRKSDVFSAMTGPIYQIEAELQGQARSGIIEAQTAKEAAEAEADGLMAKARKGGDGIDRQQLVAEASAARMLAEEIHVPPTPRLTVSGDITPEPLTSLLATHRCLAALSPEGDLFDSIAGRYSAKPNLGVFLQAHKGERLQTDRITREQPSIDKPALTIGVTPQPTVLQELAAAPGARDRGLLARFLFALPASNLGYRQTRRLPPVPEAIADRYDTRLQTLIRTLLDLSEPVTVLLSPEADAAVEDLQEALEFNLRPDQPLAHVRDWAGKLVGATVRIGGLLHLADPANDVNTSVSSTTIRQAARIAQYFTSHALAVFDLIASDPATEDAEAILDWLKRPKQNGSRRTAVKRRDVVASIRRFRGRTADIDPALRLLEDHGYLRAETPAAATKGRSANVTFRVRPDLPERPGTP